jgi:hypothetical protein
VSKNLGAEKLIQLMQTLSVRREVKLSAMVVGKEFELSESRAPFAFDEI